MDRSKIIQIHGYTKYIDPNRLSTMKNHEKLPTKMPEGPPTPPLHSHCLSLDAFHIFKTWRLRQGHEPRFLKPLKLKPCDPGKYLYKYRCWFANMCVHMYFWCCIDKCINTQIDILYLYLFFSIYLCIHSFVSLFICLFSYSWIIYKISEYRSGT